jgi:hypothetical protein
VIGSQGKSREVKGSQGKSREVKGSQGKSREVKGSQGKSREVNSAERVVCASRTIRSRREAVSAVRTESGVCTCRTQRNAYV